MKKNEQNYSKLSPELVALPPIQSAEQRAGVDTLSDEEQRKFAEEAPRPFSDTKTATKSIQFNLRDKEHREAFVGLVDQFHNQSVLFFIHQDGLSILVEL